MGRQPDCGCLGVGLTGGMFVTGTIVSGVAKAMGVSTGLAVFRRVSGYRLRTNLVKNKKIRSALDTYLQLGEWSATAIAGMAKRTRTQRAARARKAAEARNRRIARGGDA